MRKLLTLFVVLLACVACDNNSNTNKNEGWKLVWEEDFNGPSLDTTVWQRTTRGTSSWQNTQSSDPRCLEMRDGLLVLKGIVNDNLQADTAHYLTGGVVTMDKHAFDGGKVEVRARLHGAKGAWPAIWMMPYDHKYKWPDGGEIDIMERLNYDSIAYQTVHSHYTYTLGINDPPHGGKAAINPDDFNTYGVEFYQDSLVFYINGVKDFTYPRIKTDKEGQFPFNKPMYLLIDMQLGGSWVGEVDPNDLPVEMEIDWVRHYQRE